MHRPQLMVAALSLFASACSTGIAESPGPAPDAGRDAGVAADAPAAPMSCSDAGCACTLGATMPCFPGDASRAGVGICRAGAQTCVAVRVDEFDTTEWGPCEGAVLPEPGDACGDGQDNDCDGVVDNGCPCVSGQTISCSSICGSGTQTCTGGAWGPCSAPQPVGGVCCASFTCGGACCSSGTDCCADGTCPVDGACSGTCADGQVRPCASACGSGTQTCTGGAWGACSAPQPVGGVCPCDLTCGMQCCASGTACCPDGSCPLGGQCPTCTDGQSRPCATQCGSGTQTCTGGAWGACSAPQPVGGVCPCATFTCGGACCASGTACCADGTCPVGGQCPCATVTCGGVCCAAGSTCCGDGTCPVGGQCPACTNGQTQPCSTLCGTGTQTCTGGTWGACSAPQPVGGVCACDTATCGGVCCAAGTACCGDGACPAADGTCNCTDVPILFVLDRSDSMAYKPDGSAMPSLANAAKAKWSILTSAVQGLAAQWSDIPFGVDLFPGEDSKCQTLAQILQTQTYNTSSHCALADDYRLPPLSAGYSPTAVDQWVSSTTPLCYGTPLLLALQDASLKLGAFATPIKYVILVTDGEQGCNETTLQVLTAIQGMAGIGIHTIVVGFDGSGTLNSGTALGHLSKWACAGREPAFAQYCDAAGNFIGNTSLGQYSFYFADATDGSDLAAVLDAIVASRCH